MRIWILFVVIALISLASIPVFVKVQIECRTNKGQCSEEIKNGLRSSSGLNANKARNKISEYLKQNSLVSNFSIQYKLPNILSVAIVMEEPSLVINDKTSGKLYLVSKSGKLVGETNEIKFPEIIQNGKDINPYILKIIYGMHAIYNVDKLEVQDDALVVELSGQIRVLFPLEGDPDFLMGAVRLIYSKITSEEFAGKYKEIDLRFHNPILR